MSGSVRRTEPDIFISPSFVDAWRPASVRLKEGRCRDDSGELTPCRGLEAPRERWSQVSRLDHRLLPDCQRGLSGVPHPPPAGVSMPKTSPGLTSQASMPSIDSIVPSVRSTQSRPT
jgi:hypothetical protein